MDIFAHGMWTAAAGITANRQSSRRINVLWAAVWGMFPDLFAFTQTFLMMLWLRFVDGIAPSGHYLIFSNTLRDALPVFLRPDELYHYSHSLVIFSLVFGLVWWLRRSPSLVMLGWSLHILLDIPTHRAGRYGTPFAWPLSDYRFDGTSWGQDWFMMLNWSAIGVAYLALWLTRRSAARREYRANSEKALRR
jgi:hypothetical protein